MKIKDIFIHYIDEPKTLKPVLKTKKTKKLKGIALPPIACDRLEKSTSTKANALQEMFASDINNPYYDPRDDYVNQHQEGDTRTNKLTLRHLNKLRKHRQARAIELQDKNTLVKRMYSNSTPDQIELTKSTTRGNQVIHRTTKSNTNT